MGPSLGSLGLRIVAVANQKGGVGKTVTVASLASGLARQGQRVLAVDGDPQGNLTLSFGLAPADGRPELGALLSRLSETPAGEYAGEGGSGGQGRGRIDFAEYIDRRVKQRLDLLPVRARHLRTELGDVALERAGGPFALLLSRLKQHYDWILIDTSPSNGPLERLLIEAAEAVIIPMELQIFSVSGLDALLADIADCSKRTGRAILVHSLVFTKAENGPKRAETYRKIFATYGIPVYEICKSEYVQRALERGATIWDAAPSSYAARDYARIIDTAFLG